MDVLPDHVLLLVRHEVQSLDVGVVGQTWCRGRPLQVGQDIRPDKQMVLALP